MTIHWLGAGLSSGPGIKRLARTHADLTVWNRTPQKAEEILKDCKFGSVKLLDLNELKNTLAEGDIVVSMLPAGKHPGIAHLCLDNGSHFVCSSYVSPEMQAFNKRARSIGLCLVNEVGLDPGLDHLLAHDLVARYKSSEFSGKNHRHFFRSYCGGFPKVPNEFKYKFSWSPLGVLRALKTPANWIEGSSEKSTEAPWHSLSEYSAPLPFGAETFQAYPNRDSRPFIRQYSLDDGWHISQFVRGTLRLEGWSRAWADIFTTLESLEQEKADEILGRISDDLWNRYSYNQGEPDRVVLCVELEIKESSGRVIWHQSYTLDETGNQNGSAMARLVSLPMSLAVESILNKELPAGVTAAPADPGIIENWFLHLNKMGESIHHKDHLSV